MRSQGGAGARSGALRRSRRRDRGLPSRRRRPAGIGPADLPETVVYCSITGFGLGGRHELRAGHDLNYQGWAGLLADTAPALPPRSWPTSPLAR